jgi:hypothetical protein
VIKAVHSDWRLIMKIVCLPWKMLRNNLGNRSSSRNEDGSVFSQTEHNIVATYLIMAGMFHYSINSYLVWNGYRKTCFQHEPAKLACPCGKEEKYILSLIVYNLGCKDWRRTRHWWLIPEILAMWETEIGRIVVWGQPWQIVWEIPISKITRAKWIGGVAQVVEHLLCKCKTLGFKPHSTKK